MFYLRADDRALPVLLAYVPMAMLMVHYLLGAGRITTRTVFLVWVALVPLIVRALLDVRTAYAISVAGNLSFGMVGGWLLVSATRQGRGRDRWTPVDAGLGVFLFVTALQVMLSPGRGTGGAFHHTLELNWGRSNLVAAVLLLGCVQYAARIVACRPRWLWCAPVVPALLAIVMILSRGAVAGALFGIAFAIQRFGLSRKARNMVARTVLASGLVAGVAVLAVFAVGAINDARRAQSPTDSLAVRGDLWRIAWEDFSDAPILGSGFGSLRESSLESLGQPYTYPHNVFLSLLQQAGLFGVPFLLVFLYLVGRLVHRRQSWFLVAGAGALVFLASVEIVVENPVAGLLAWSIVWSGE